MNTLRIPSNWRARLSGCAAALLLTAGGAANAAIVTVDLCATTGVATGLPASPAPISVPVLGYVVGACTSATTVSAPGGPVIYADVGDTVTVNLSNRLNVATGLLFQGQAIPPDTTGAPAAGANFGTKSYTFVVSNPGTYLYEAAPLGNTVYQNAMGLHGALVVRSTVGTAYGIATSAFTDEAVLVLSEIDTALNTKTDPSTFDMRNFSPKYFLINGKSYPDTKAIDGLLGNKLLLRYVNAGVKHHSMGVLGLRQTFVAKDGNLLPTQNHNVAAETLAPGQTGDAIVTMPAVTILSRYAIYDAGLSLHNSNASGMGGMLTFVTAGTGSVVGGPITSGVTLNPGVSIGNTAIALSASVAGTGTPTNTIAAAEYFIDRTGTAGSGTALTGTYGSATVAVTGNLSAAVVGTLTSGKHTVYVHGKDSTGAWGAFSSGTFTIDKTGPTTSGLSLTPNPSNGKVAVALHASADDSASGGSNVTAAEYFIGPPGIDGSGRALALSGTATAVGLDATLTPTLAAPLTNVDISVHSKDELGNWGPFTTIKLNVITTPPTVNNLAVSPSPNNGALALGPTQSVVRVSATASTATATTIATAEGFIDNPPTSELVRGFPFVAADGAWNGATENAYSDIPLANINALTAGNHTVYVRAKDAVGNWSALAATTLVIDKTPPTVSGLTSTPSQTNGTPVVISATATDAIGPIFGGEYFIDPAGGTPGAAGTGTPMTRAAAAASTTISATITATALATLVEGSHTIVVRARDAAGNWSATTSVTLVVDRTVPTFSGFTLAPTSITAGTATVNLTVNGANDGAAGSGVNLGEYWFGTPDPAAGFGTTFTLPGTTTVATASLTAGTYTVRVRVRDAAGNWSTQVRTATLTVTGPAADAIFSNGFDTGNRPWGWTSTSTNNTVRLDATAAAALLGTTRGLAAQGGNNNTNYVQYDFGTTTNPATATFDARFYFNPNGNTGANEDIFVARTGVGGNANTVFRVRYRWNNGAPQVQIQVGNGTGNANWTPISNSAANRIEVVWQAGSTLQLYVGSGTTAAQTLTGVGNSSVGAFRLGAVSTGGAATLQYFDSFSAKRAVTPLFGP